MGEPGTHWESSGGPLTTSIPVILATSVTSVGTGVSTRDMGPDTVARGEGVVGHRLGRH